MLLSSDYTILLLWGCISVKVIDTVVNCVRLFFRIYKILLIPNIGTVL